MADKKKLLGERSPLPIEYRKMVNEVMEKMNEDAMKEFTPHDILLMLIDRGHAACFPERTVTPKRKKYSKLPF